MTRTEATPYIPPPNYHRMLQALCTNVLVYSNPAFHGAKRCLNNNPTGGCCLWHTINNSVTPSITAHIYALVKNAQTLCGISPSTAGMFYLSSSKEWHVKMVVQGLQYTKPYEDTDLAHRIFNNLKSSDLALVFAHTLHFPVMLEHPPPATQPNRNIAMLSGEVTRSYTNVRP